MDHTFDLPSPELLQQQAAWLAPARARLLRCVHIARRRRVLDLGCGFGATTAELARRGGGVVVALDRRREVFSPVPAGVARVCGDAERLPFADGSFDLVFCQFVLLWLDAAQAVAEIHRVLEPGGALVAIEPDYGGMIEHPPQIATRDLWLAALARAGADPLIGRKLPGLLADAGFSVHVDLLDRLSRPSPVRFDLLRGLPQTNDERHALQRARASDTTCDDAHRVVHLPIFLMYCTRRS